MALICITGASRGVGLELSRQYRDRGDHVVAACRKVNDRLEKLGVEVVTGVDVAFDDGVDALTHALGDRVVDILVNNAGILSDESLSDLDFGRMRQQFEVNSLGPLRVSAALRGNFTKGSKHRFSAVSQKRP